MRVLLDELLPIGLRDLLPGHDVVTASFAGLAGVSNGGMIRGAVAGGFNAILSLGRGIANQQNLSTYPISLVLIDDNDVDMIRPYFPAQAGVQRKQSQ